MTKMYNVNQTASFLGVCSQTVRLWINCGRINGVKLAGSTRWSVSENKKPIAILNKEDWESNRFNHIKEKCRQYIPPFFVDRREIPFVGVGINVDLTNCERR